MLQAMGFSMTRGHSAHAEVQERLLNSGVQASARAGRELRRFQSVRVTADYWMRDPAWEEGCGPTR